ncbi:malto-oligosyltrehalose synthase [Zunongwangia sp. H14]|uniref:malto-oligosyltrehalose synthase n=1 Tax=Zunongwangia sp. H14 TaxID=3240792 RepID=UPI003565CF13
MSIPVTTYRVQMSPNFTFEDLKEIIDYLDQLGISTIYSAPFFKAREGSTHGYDVVDPFIINPAIGKLEDFRELCNTLQKRKMDWLQDIVPNHMAFDSSNPWLHDIFELGPASVYYKYFDINWNYKGWNKVMAPFLGDSLEEIISRKELKIIFDNGRFALQYFDHIYPIAAKSYAFVLGEEGAGWQKKFKDFSEKAETWQQLKLDFHKEVQNDAGVKSSLSQRLKLINDQPDKMEQLLELQFFKPVHWKTTESEINYRRFFTINDLICLSMENEEVFVAYHSFMKKLLDTGLVKGLRVDHIDGLFDPEGYTRQLRALVGKDVYLIVEKILEAEEKLPVSWPVQGTSGYEFLAQVNHLFTASENKEFFSEQYHKLASEIPEYEDMVYKKKLFILKERMGGELHNLMMYLKQNDLLAEDLKEEHIKEALSTFLAAFPVYRVYPQEYPLDNLEVEIIDKAYRSALERETHLRAALSYLKSILTGEAGNKDKCLYFLKRCQQFSGPLAAKGVEDTSFYIYNRLILHNEVGDSPENFGISVKEFHKKMLEKKEDFPHAMNTTATHDTKRGEDSRMRLAALSEFPAEWFQKVKEWKEINKSFKNKNAPDVNEEYFIYQALVGAVPFNDYDKTEFLQRTKDYLQKVMREAKVNSNWSSPNEEHETAVFKFTEIIAEHPDFQKAFDPFQKKIAALGVIKSLAQICIKYTVPGVPDTYQGTELWDLSYVDPDNRRPVDYKARRKYLEEISNLKRGEEKAYLQKLKKNPSNGKIKFYVLHKLITHRSKNALLFENGNYLPLEISGNLQNKLIAFARKLEGKWSITVAPVLLRPYYEELTPDVEMLKESFLRLPENIPGNFKNIFTAEIYEENKIEINKLLGNFPVAVLINN